MAKEERRFISEHEWSQYETLFEPGSRLPRHALLLDRIGGALARGRRTNRFVALVVFSDVRSTCTHELGLQEVAQLMQERLSADDTVALVHNLAIIAVCSSVESPEQIQAITQRVTENLGVECEVRVIFNDAQQDAELLYASAIGHVWN